MNLFTIDFMEKNRKYQFLNILLPLILSNTNIQKSEDEVIKLIKSMLFILKKKTFI